MTLAEFIANHNGRYLDYDGHYGAQCVDLIDYYCAQVLGIPIAWANAVDWFGKDSPYLDWIHNTPTNMPPPGAIVVWGPNYRVGTGVYGHIGIAVDRLQTMSFRSFDQNWPPGSACHLQPHTYDGVIGWGVLKAKPPPPTPRPVIEPVTEPGTPEGSPSQNWLLTFLDWLARIFGFRRN